MSLHRHHDLIEACRKQNPKAQFELYEHYKRYLFNLNLRMLSNRTEAEDALQETFLEAFTKIGHLRDNITFGSWIKRIAVRKCADLLRKKKIDFEEIGEREFESTDVEENKAAITPANLHREIQNLPAGCRSVFTLYEMEGYDHKEISEILEVSESTSKTQLFRARKLLAVKLKIRKIPSDQN